MNRHMGKGLSINDVGITTEVVSSSKDFNQRAVLEYPGIKVSSHSGTRMLVTTWDTASCIKS